MNIKYWIWDTEESDIYDDSASLLCKDAHCYAICVDAGNRKALNDIINIKE